MIELLKQLCALDGTSGDEGNVRDFIIQKIDGHCDWRVDALGNIIAFKKGKKRSAKKLLIDAHTDEVGLIITAITSDGFLKFSVVGGIDTAALISRKVKLSGGIYGVIGTKPIHLMSGDERKKPPKAENLYIDIGACDEKQARQYVAEGDRAVICNEWVQTGDKIMSKALDDRIGCAVLIKLLCDESEYDFYASFSVQEEVGLRGAKTAAFAVGPEYALVIEATTAADITGVENDHRVCTLGNGVAVSFMDRSTVYDRGLYTAALSSGIKCQPKCAVAGGNNSGAVHLSREGVKTLALSAPCRYIHTSNSVVDINDINAVSELARYMLNSICSGEIE